MKKNSPIKMKTTKQFSNPAKNEVLDGSDDSVLSNYIREISDYRSLTPAEEKETDFYAAILLKLLQILTCVCLYSLWAAKH